MKLHNEYLKKHPSDVNKRELLKKVKKNLNKVKEILEYHSYFLCPNCKQVFRSNNEIMNHTEFKHNIRSIKCYYCNEQFVSETDLSTHKEALKLFEKSLTIVDNLGDLQQKAHRLWWIGILFGKLKKKSEAIISLKKSIAIYEEIVLGQKVKRVQASLNSLKA